MDGAQQTAHAAAAFVLDEGDADGSQSKAVELPCAAASSTRPLELVDDRAEREQEAAALRQLQEGDRKLQDILRRQSAVRRKRGLAHTVGRHGEHNGQSASKINQDPYAQNAAHRQQEEDTAGVVPRGQRHTYQEWGGAAGGPGSAPGSGQAPRMRDVNNLPAWLTKQLLSKEDEPVSASVSDSVRK